MAAQVVWGRPRPLGLVRREGSPPGLAAQGREWTSVTVARRGDLSVAEVAVDFDISEESLRRWVKQADIDDGLLKGQTSSEQGEVVQLRRKLRKPELENEILRRTGRHGEPRWRACQACAMTRKSALYLIGYMLWSFFVWITLVKNIAHDHLPTHGTAFHVVHYVLAAVSLVLAAGVGYVGVRGLRPASPELMDLRESDSP